MKNWYLKYLSKILDVKYTIINDVNNPNIHIKNSYLIKSDKVKRLFLKEIMKDKLFKEVGRTRSMDSYLKEWKAHNYLYSIGIEPDRTKDVDLDEKDDRQTYYELLSFLE